MLSKNLHIITLNIPYPPDYGGMIDTFYRIKSLNELGIDIHLHCFEYGRPHSKELESICKTVNYYPRRRWVTPFSSLPHIVSTRRSKLLLENLKKNNYPIIFDGLHTAFYLNHQDLLSRKKLVRSHNIEHNYYRSLAINESDLFKKVYFFLESFKLKKYEKALSSANYILSISENDHNYFNKKYQNSVILPPFHPFSGCETKSGSGDYVIFHGDLSIKENVLIADSLISNVFSKIHYNCVIAGKNPPDYLINKSSAFPNIKIIPNPGVTEMTRLITEAHINVIPSFICNGFKIKLLYSLFTGRHCLVNTKMIEGTHTSEICHIADSNSEITDKIKILMKQEFIDEMITERRKVLDRYYNNVRNASKLAELIFTG
jgi:hypothetical protein